MDRAFIFINGIQNRADSSGCWTERAEVYCAEKGLQSARYPYTTTFATRWIMQPYRVRQFAKLCNDWAERFKLVLVGHSNGCDIILQSLAKIESSGIELHLISAAAEPDCWRNGLNESCATGKVARVTIYIGQQDEVLSRLAPVSRFLCGWLGLGFKNLGHVGPLNSTCANLTVHTEPEFGHSTWFEPQHFPSLMRLVTHP